MRDRLQRRKKKPEEASDQPAPPPLQPAYFDAEQEAGPVPSVSHMESELSEPAPPAADAPVFESAHTKSEEQPFEATNTPAAPRSASQAARGRRRRGGRGRGGRGREQSVAQAFAPAALKGSIPGAPVDTGEEESGGGELEAQAPVQRSVPARSSAPPRATTPAPQASPKGVVSQSDCPAPARVRGSSATILSRSRATWCARSCLTMSASSGFKTWYFPICDPCSKRG